MRSMNVRPVPNDVPMTNPLGTQDPVDIAVFECLIAHGVDGVTMERIGRQVGVSRATFCRRYSTLRELVRGTHARATRLIGWWVPAGRDDKRFEFEWWWATMMEVFASPWGRAFLAMRPLAAAGAGMHEVDRRELALMPDLERWAKVSAPVLRAMWALVIAAACPSLDEKDRETLRELVFAMVVPPPLGEDAEEELAHLHALHAPL